MKYKQKILKIFFLLFFSSLSAFHYDLKAQNISTYYVFPSDVQEVRGLDIDTAGNFYFFNFDQNWNGRFSKLSTDGTISTIASAQYYYPEKIVLDNAGNIYFTDMMMMMESGIKKVASDGTITDFFSNNSNSPDLNFTFDALGNMYFVDRDNGWPEIKKVTSDGTVSTFFANPNYYPDLISFDESGSLYFIDNFKFPGEINKISPDGSVSSIVSGTFRPENLLIDREGNIFFIDRYDRPYDIKKVTPDGTITIFTDPGLMNNPRNLTIDKSGNLYFIESSNYQYTIRTIRNSTAPPVETADLSGLNKYGSMSSDNATNVNENGAIATLTKVDRNGKIRIQGIDGLSAGNAAASAYEIKQNFPNSPDGYYWIKNPNVNGGNAFKIYADMTTEGGGWTLIMCNKNPNSGWTNANAVLRNQTNPNNNGNYSIIAWADYIKRSSSGFQYMMDASTRRSYGGIWTVNKPYSFVSRSNANTDITINTKFGNWNYFDGGGFGPRMPWWTNQTNDGIITTSQTGNNYWWGTLITGNGWNPSPWLSGEQGTLNMQNPGIIWYWVR